MSKLINLEDLNEFKNQIFNAIYPINCVYTTIDSSETENTLHNKFGGTWVALNSGNALIVAKSQNQMVVNGALHKNYTAYQTRIQVANGTNTFFNPTNNSFIIQKASYMDFSNVDPGSIANAPGFINNLWTEIDGISVYMFKRTA